MPKLLAVTSIRPVHHPRVPQRWGMCLERDWHRPGTMDRTDPELEVALAIADASEWAVGRPLGVPTRHDDGSEPQMVDYLFEDAAPPVALEITAIVDSEFLETADVASKINERFDAHARDLGAGRWTIHFAAGTRLRPLISLMEQPMSDGLDEEDSPLRRGLPDGVISVYIEPRGADEVQIGAVNSSGNGRLRGFSAELSDAITENMAKLTKMADHERHLAIDMQAMRASDPGETPPPTLPEVLDHLWVMRRRVSATRKPPVVWVTEHGGTGWKVNAAPYE